jgi:cytochrome c-type biogenesis protein CcmE
MNRTIKILLTVAVVGGAVAYLMTSSLNADVSVYKYVHELMVAPDDWVGKDVKAHGYVEAGSIQQSIDAHTQTTRFVLENKGQRLAVATTEPMPDTFKDLSEVIARGTIAKQTDGTYLLTASEIMAKCPSKYEENQRTRSATGAR